jgi:cellulose synthase/poly-beta-1,6-N-acetylglucosamine synthase-like glycosyltransferase
VYFISIILFAITILYILLQFVYLIYWNKIKKFEKPAHVIPRTTVSIIIPARNEEENIVSCVQSALDQNYPHHLLEVIVVDDQSEDQTPELLEDIKDSRFKLMRLGVIGKTTIQGSKKKAISYGVAHAHGTLIIATDADCVLPKNWVETIVSYYELNAPKFIIGPVQIKNGKGFLGIFQMLDFMNSFLINASGIKSGLHYLCSAANIAYDKNTFIQINAYDTNHHISSGDDIFLIHKMKSLFPHDIHVLKSVETIVETKAEIDLKHFISQRLRWANKMKFNKDWKVMFIASLVWFQRIFTIISIIIGFIYQNPLALYIGWISLCTQLVLDFIILYQATTFFSKKHLLWWFIPMQFFYTLYFILLGLFSWFNLPLYWKDRKI